MAIPEHPVVLATVKSKSEVEDGWKLELDIPEFKSQFPVLCTRVDAQVAAQLKPGQTPRVVLARQNLKKEKSTGNPKSGTYYSDYYWGLERLATEADAPTPTPVAVPVATSGSPQGTAYGNRNETSIEAQTCLKAAVELQVAFLGTGGLYAAPAFLDLVKDMALGLAAAKGVLGRSIHTGEAPTVLTPDPAATSPAAAVSSPTQGPAEHDQTPQKQGASPTKPAMTFGEFWAEWRADKSLPQGSSSEAQVRSVIGKPLTGNWYEGLDLAVVLAQCRAQAQKGAQA